MKKSIVLWVVALALAIVPALPVRPAQESQSAEVLLGSALHQEEVEGNLEAAIQTYKKLLAAFPDNRPLAAQALLRMGKCYEKLGRDEARKAYEQLVKDYADQAEQAKEAQSRLAALKPGPEAGRGALRDNAGPTFRKIDFPGSGSTPQVRLSPDGRKILYIGVQDAEPRCSLRLLDFATGRSQTLAEKIDGNYWTHIFCWSPDGKKIVFMPRPGEIRMINSGGGTADPFWTAPGKGIVIMPLDWSDQSHAILLGLFDQSRHTASLATIPEKGGEPRTIVSGDTSELNYRGQFSPDGKFIVGNKTKDKNSDIYVWSAEAGAETRITDHPADDYYPLWSPDGKYIVFLSDRAKTVNLWAVPMAGSQPAGLPFRIQAAIGKNKAPSDFTKSGQLVFDVAGSQGNPPDLFVLPVDPVTGDAKGSLRPHGKYPTDNLGGFRWSPDGSLIAYASRKGNYQLPYAYVSSGGANEDLEIPANGYWMGNLEWSPDGESLLFPGFLRDDERVGIFRIPLDKITVAPVHMSGERLGQAWKGYYAGLRWLPLAGKFMFRKWLSESEEEIYLLDPSDDRIQRVGEKIRMMDYEAASPDGRYVTGIDPKSKDFILLSLPDGASRILSTLSLSKVEGYPYSWSPDGKKLAYYEGRRLMMVPVPDGKPQTLFEADQNRKIGAGLADTPTTAWSPDGGKIAFGVQSPAGDSKVPSELWVVGVNGEPAKKIADAPSSHSLIAGVIWHASGEKVFVAAFDPKSLGKWNEFWVMENFLPEEAPKNKDGK